MFTQDRTPREQLIVGGPVPTTSHDNGIVAALFEGKPVMLIHALNGGYLKPVNLTGDNHSGGAKTETALDNSTKDQRGHLWYITPGGYFGQRTLYLIESAAGEKQDNSDTTEPRGDDGRPKPKRRRITIHNEAPTEKDVYVGLPDKVDEKWRGKNGVPEDTQLWIVTVTPWGGITFVPITRPDTILGFKDHQINVGGSIRLTNNWGGDFAGSLINTYYPRLPNEWGVPYHHVLA